MKIVRIIMRYSIEPRGRIYVKGYGFLSFAKNMDKSLSNKYRQRLLDSAKKSTTDAKKQHRKEATGDLIGNKITDKILSFSKKKLAMKLHFKELHNNDKTREEDVEIATHKRKTHKISAEEKQNLIDELRLIPKKELYF